MKEALSEQNLGEKKKAAQSKKKINRAIRVNNEAFKTIIRLVEKANKKIHGKRVNPSHIVDQIIELADNNLFDKAIKRAQENSLRLKDKENIFEKEMLQKYKGSLGEMKQEMMEVFKRHIAENSVS